MTDDPRDPDINDPGYTPGMHPSWSGFLPALRMVALSWAVIFLGILLFRGCHGT